MSHRIDHINRSSLWLAWKAVRKQLRYASWRDVVDFLEYDIDPDRWIRRLLRQVNTGEYEPIPPYRFSLAKSKGFSRKMTFPAIPDLVLYRAIVDHLYQRVRRKEQKHVYFERRSNPRAVTKHAKGTSSFEDNEASYEPKSQNRFLAWLRYDQYRKYLIFEKVYPFILTTDITNFFDSILYNRIADALYGLPINSKMIGLLFFILERLSIREPYSESPRIGLPVDEFDCSRKLAHIILFPHDERMVKLVGENAYVRWMDDQVIGVSTEDDGYKMIAAIGDSISRLHLSPNAQKTRILSLSESRRHFHLDINKRLDEIEALPTSSKRKRAVVGRKLRQLLNKYKKHEGEGEWTKILKRVYRLAGLAQTRMLRRRATRDILQTPLLARRIADYMRCSGTAEEYIRFAQTVWGNTRQLYTDVNLTLVESLLRLETDTASSARIRGIASNLLQGKLKIDGALVCAEVAPLLILRFGDRRSLPLLRRSFEKKPGSSQPITRASSIVFASYGIDQFRVVRRAAAAEFRSNLPDLVLLLERIRSYKSVPGSYKARLAIRKDSVAGRHYVDMRSILTARLLLLNNKAPVRNWVRDRRESLCKESISSYDKDVLKRLLPL